MAKYKTSGNTFQIDTYIDTTDDGIRVLSDDEVGALNKEKLPKNIVKEFSVWKKPVFSVRNAIMNGSFADLPDGRLKFDIGRHVVVRIRYLLVDWSLKESDPSLKLSHVDVGDGFGNKILSNESFKALMDVDGELVHDMYSKAMSRIYPDEAVVVNPPSGVKK
jgi:hypothetical protein